MLVSIRILKLIITQSRAAMIRKVYPSPGRVCCDCLDALSPKGRGHSDERRDAPLSRGETD